MTSFQLFVVLMCVIFTEYHENKVNAGMLISRSEQLDKQGNNYWASWTVDLTKDLITFNVTVKTNGYIGFGLSPTGGMADADIVIGCVYPNGTAYFSDRHGTSNTQPVVDEKQNWNLTSGTQNATHTTLVFFRVLDTCDPDDVIISNDTLNIIWAFGSFDEVEYHNKNRGSFSVNFLDPQIPPLDTSAQKWNLTVNMTMPSVSTSYWCTVHRGPILKSKHHVIGFEPKLIGQSSIEHTHHFVIFRCVPPKGKDAKTHFEPFVNSQGGECYDSVGKNGTNSVPIVECQQTIYVWGAGGKHMVLPAEVGYPIGESENEYFMMQIHYDNPKKLSNVKFESGVQVYYTNKLRKNDAGLLELGHSIITSHVIPPKSPSFVIAGHCSSGCTTQHFPDTGIRVFNVFMHSHLSGRKLKVRHFRDGKELPWLMKDDTYNFNYQQSRPLPNEVVLKKGDHLTYECTYNTSWTDGTVIAGLSTRNEMCVAYVWYYPRIPLEHCQSFYPLDQLPSLFGMQNITWVPGATEPIVTGPGKMTNMTFTKALDTEVKWTDEFKKSLQKTLRFDDHLSLCSVKKDSGNDSSSNDSTTGQPMPRTTYPKFAEEYKLITKCPSNASKSGK